MFPFVDGNRSLQRVARQSWMARYWGVLALGAASALDLLTTMWALDHGHPETMWLSIIILTLGGIPLLLLVKTALVISTALIIKFVEPERPVGWELNALLLMPVVILLIFATLNFVQP